MFFSKEIEVSAQTSKTDPLITTLKLSKGIIRHVWVMWRYGVGNLGGVRILHNEFQVWPMTLGEWLPSSRFPFDSAADYPVTTAAFSVDIHTYNLDDVYPHTVWVAFNMEQEQEFGYFTRLLRWLKAEEY